MIYNYPDNILISYLGGTFGNALSGLILSAISNNIYHPNNNNFHVIDWPIETSSCMITEDSVIKFKRQLSANDIIQLHCLNADLIYYKFPASRSILLTCNPEDEYFGIQRQWLVNTNPASISVDNILNAWDWIGYNLNYYNSANRIQQHDKILCLNFKSVSSSYNLIENYLELTLSNTAREMYETYITAQTNSFYNINENFAFAWKVFTEQGANALINDLAKDFIK
jgi:hypothetical protein